MKEKWIEVWKYLKFPILLNLIFSVLWRLILLTVDQKSEEFLVPGLVAYFMTYGGFFLVYLCYGVWFRYKHDVSNKQMWLFVLEVFMIGMITMQPMYPAVINPPDSFWLVLVALQQTIGFLLGFLIGKIYRYFLGSTTDGSASPLQRR